MKKRILLAVSMLLVCGTARAEIRGDEILELSQGKEPGAYNYTVREGATIVPTSDGRSFIVWWQPDNFNPATDTVLVSLHGHGGWATKDFQVWHSHLKNRGYAFMAVQW